MASDRAAPRAPLPALPRWVWVLAFALVACLALSLILIRLMGPAAARLSVPGTALSIPIPLREPPPVVEPLELKPIKTATALEINNAIPFSRAPNPAARPFIASGTPDNLARAADCLAVAVYYEAGDDEIGQRAVAQVIVNRLRHPSFPKTVCGVVFQGSERVTGCQFSFTCDASLARRQPGSAAWQRARMIATQALNGHVYAPVGYATHYHTDWVVPYWSASLEKNAAVETHLFFRWRGTWGRPRAFYGSPSGQEPIVAAIAALSIAHRAAGADVPTIVAASGSPAGATDAGVTAPGQDPVAGLTFVPTPNNANIFVVALPASLDRDRYPEVAARACGDRPRCVFMGWKDAGGMPVSLPAATWQLQGMAFHYIRDPGLAKPRSRWDCSAVRRADAEQCLSHQVATPRAGALPPGPVISSRP